MRIDSAFLLSMSDKAARVHTNLSNRLRARNGAERKAVFKSVLDNPFRIEWPDVKLDLQRQALAILLSIVCCVSEYSMESRKKSRRRRKTATPTNVPPNRKRRRLDDESSVVAEGTDNTTISESTKTSEVQTAKRDPPPVLQHMTVGINEVTKRLEQQVRNSRHKLTVSEKGTVSTSDTRPVIKFVFVCRADIDPPLLVAHIPHLVAACNSCVHDPEPHVVKLVLLPKGAEFTLAEAIGYRRVAVIALDAASTELTKFDSVVELFPTLVAKWWTPPAPLIPTHVKQVRTSAPADMRAAKQHRVQERHAAKQRKKRMAGDTAVPGPLE